MFKSINGLEGKYSISEEGIVISHERKDKVGRIQKQRIIAGSFDKDGYRRVVLSLGSRGHQKTFRVARLVAETYLLNPDNKEYVNHIDGVKTNDHVSNLEWVTAKENTIHAWNNGLCKPYDRSKEYNREGIIKSNKNRRKWFGTHKEYCKMYYERSKLKKQTVKFSV